MNEHEEVYQQEKRMGIIAYKKESNEKNVETVAGYSKVLVKDQELDKKHQEEVLIAIKMMS